MTRVVVVGGSIAALTAVTTLRAEGFDGSVVMLSAEPHPPYTRVPLSKSVLQGTEEPGSVYLDVPDDVDLRLDTPARALDLTAREIHTAGSRVPFDEVIIATGARARRLGAADQAELVLRSVDDANSLRMRLGDARTVVIVGGGVLGMEMASTCAALGRSVTVVDVAPPMARMLGPVVAGAVQDAARTAGVRVRLSPGGVTLVGRPMVHTVVTDDGESHEADLVITAAGDVPNVEWLHGCGLTLRAGVVVDDRCRAAPGVSAAGDVAIIGTTRTPTWTSAVEQGRVAALSALYGAQAPQLRPSRYAWTTQFGLNIKLVGELSPRGIPDTVEGDLAAGSALLTWTTGGIASTVVSVNHPIAIGKLKRLVPQARQHQDN